MRGFGVVGYWCNQTCKRCGRLSLCEHNLKDASVNPMNVCTGRGGDCLHGEKFSCVADETICEPLMVTKRKGD